MRAARKASSLRITESTCFRIRTRSTRVSTGSTFIRYASQRGSFGASRRRRETPSIWTFGTTISNMREAKDMHTETELPGLPRDEGGPVFAEPWQAQAFALAIRLSEQ